MITVVILRQGGTLAGFTSSGHADYAEYGKDIACSAVSALTQTCLIGLTDVLHLVPEIVVSERTGIRCRLGADTAEAERERASLLIETMAAGLRSIQQSYPGTLKIVYREV